MVWVEAPGPEIAIGGVLVPHRDEAHLRRVRREDGAGGDEDESRQHIGIDDGDHRQADDKGEIHQGKHAIGRRRESGDGQHVQHRAHSEKHYAHRP